MSKRSHVWSATGFALCAFACASDVPVDTAEQNLVIDIVSNFDIALDTTTSPPSLANDIREWTRDASVSIDGVGCGGTLISPRVVVTSAHCVTDGGGVYVQLSPRNPNHTEVPPLPEVPPGTPTWVRVNVVGCSTHPQSGIRCTGAPGVNALEADYDLAVLLLQERVDVGLSGTRTTSYPVLAAETVPDDPRDIFGNIDSPWVGTPTIHVGWGKTCFEGSACGHSLFSAMRQFQGQTINVSTLTTSFLPEPVGTEGDSGGGVFLADNDAYLLSGHRRRLLGVFNIHGLEDAFVRVSSPGARQWLTSTLGDPVPGTARFTGAMVPIGIAPHFPAQTRVWTGDVDVPPATEPLLRMMWATTHPCPVPAGSPAGSLCGDPDTLDPDGDGLVGGHDNCWGVYNPDQDSFRTVVGSPPPPLADNGRSRDPFAVPVARRSEPGTAGALCITARSCRTTAGFPTPADPTPGTLHTFNCLAPTGTTELWQTDVDHDCVADECDNCIPSMSTAFQCGRTSTANPGQEDRDHNGIGDLCELDRDCDGVQDIVVSPSLRPSLQDNCAPPASVTSLPAVLSYYNPDQADCHDQALTALNAWEMSVGRSQTLPVGDVCDPQPCPLVSMVEPGRNPGGPLRFDTMHVDTYATPPLAAVPTAFRFCRCDGATFGNDSINALRSCEPTFPGSPFTGGCQIVNRVSTPFAFNPRIVGNTDPVLVGVRNTPTSGTRTEARPWRWMTLEATAPVNCQVHTTMASCNADSVNCAWSIAGLGICGPAPAAPAALPYSPVFRPGPIPLPPVIPPIDTRPPAHAVPDFTATWDVFEHVTAVEADTSRWGRIPAPGVTGLPGDPGDPMHPPETFFGSRVSGVIWASVTSAPVADFDPDLSDRYTTGTFTPPVVVPVPPPTDLFHGFAAYITQGGWWGQVPFVGVHGPGPLCDYPPNCEVAIRVGALTVPRTVVQSPPELDLFAINAQWVGVSEPREQLVESNLRYVALGLDAAGVTVDRILFEQAGVLTTGVKAICQGICDPPQPGDSLNVLSAHRGTLWRIENAPMAVVWNYDFATAVWSARTAPRLGHVLAAVYSRADDFIWVLDEASEGRRRSSHEGDDDGEHLRGREHSGDSIRRLVALWPETGFSQVVAEYEHRAHTTRFALAMDPNRGLYLIASEANEREHRVALLAASSSGVHVIGVREGHGTLVPGMARGERTQMAVLVDTGHGEDVVTHSLSSFFPSHGESDGDDSRGHRVEDPPERADLSGML